MVRATCHAVDTDPLQESGKAGSIMCRLVLPGLTGALLCMLAFGRVAGAHAFDKAGLQAKFDEIVLPANERQVPCISIAAQRPIVVLAIGQSNAANHGVRPPETGTPIVLVAGGKCLMAADPLPGSTGIGASIWYRLPQYFSQLEPQRLLVLSVLGVDATSIEDWVAEKSPLGDRLVNQVKSMRALDLMPHLVLWQQGEAEARLGTTAAAYGDRLDKLARILAQAGANAPIVMARSTVCRSAPNAAVRAAVEAKAASNTRFRLGPDTDGLRGADLRRDGCHFSAQGLDRAAQLWAATIVQFSSRK